MKNSCFLFALLALAPLARAVGPGDVPTPGVSLPHATLYMARGILETTGVTATSLPFTYDGTTVAAGETIKFVWVVPQSGVALDRSTPPFTFAADGTLQPSETIATVAWAALGAADQAGNGYALDADGYPVGGGLWVENGGGLQATMPVYWPDSVEVPVFGSAYLYIVTFDSRTLTPGGTAMVAAEPNLTEAKAPTPLTAWSATLCASVALPAVGSPTGPMVILNMPEDYESGTTLVAVNKPTTVPAPITELTVDGETLTDPAAIEAALKPAISGMSLAQGGGTPTLSLTLSPAQAPDITTYTLETADALDGTWVPFDTFLQEKGLANSDAMRYTKWRINEEGVVSIPLFNDTTRFYRLRGDRNLQGETR